MQAELHFPINIYMIWKALQCLHTLCMCVLGLFKIEIWLIYNIISVSVYSVMHDLVFADNTPFKVITEEWIYFIFKSNASAYLFVELFFTVS